MTRTDFLLAIDDLLELPAGTLKGTEQLENLESWNSMAMIGYIALVDSETGTQISPQQIRQCTSVDDLIRLAKLD